MVAALEVVSPGQLRDQVGALWELESKAFKARELAMSLRQKHVENQNQPSATSTPHQKSQDVREGTNQQVTPGCGFGS